MRGWVGGMVMTVGIDDTMSVGVGCMVMVVGVGSMVNGGVGGMVMVRLVVC